MISPRPYYSTFIRHLKVWALAIAMLSSFANLATATPQISKHTSNISESAPQISAEDRVDSKSLEIAATVLATTSGIAFTVLAILFQVTGYPQQLLSKQIRRDILLWITGSFVMLTLILEIVGASFSREQLFVAVVANRFFAPLALIALAISVFRLIRLLELRPVVIDLSREFADSDDL
jgi:hypothetical protein